MDRSSLGDSQLRASLFFLCALSQAADGARTCSVSISYVLQPAEPMLPTACSTQQITRARARGQITQASRRPLLPTDPVAHSRAQRERGRDMCSACRRGEMSVNVHWITIYTNTHQGQSVSRGSWEESWETGRVVAMDAQWRMVFSQPTGISWSSWAIFVFFELGFHCCFSVWTAFLAHILLSLVSALDR